MNIYELYESELKKHAPEEMALPKSETEIKQEQELKGNIKELLLLSIKAMFLWGLKETENMSDFVRTAIQKELSRNCYNPNITVFIRSYRIEYSTSNDSFTYEIQQNFSDMHYCEFERKTKCSLFISIYPSKNWFKLHIWDNSNNCGRLEKRLLKECLYELDVAKKIEEDPLGVCEIVKIDIDKLTNYNS